MASCEECGKPIGLIEYSSATLNSLGFANLVARLRNGAVTAYACSPLLRNGAQSYVALNMATTCQIEKTGKPLPNAKDTQPRSSVTTQNAQVFIFPQANERALVLGSCDMCNLQYEF